MIIKGRHLNPWIVYLIATMTIVAPLLFSYYVLTLDLVFAPTLAMPDKVGHTYILDVVLHVLNLMIPSYVLEKLILSSTILLIGIGGYMFAKKIAEQYHRSQPHYSYYLCGFVYLFNPFVYSHFMAGQYLVLLGYALIPFYTYALLKLLGAPSWRHASVVLVWLVITSILSLHTVGLLLIISLPLTALYAYRNWGGWYWYKTSMLCGLGVITGFVVACSYWLIPAIFGEGKIAEALDGFNATDFTAFATSDSVLGVLGNVLTMQGFWADATNLYLTSQDLYWWWLIPFYLLSVLIFAGVYKGWRTLRGLTVALLVMFGVAVVLATGVSGSIFAPINEWLVAYVPFFAGYREPQKFVAIVVLVYALLASFGLSQMVEWLKQWDIKHWYIDGFCIAMLAVPIAYAPLMLWGFSGQLRSVDYPADWYSMNTYLEQNIAKNDKVLALPWHMYMRFKFAERVIANPMDKFFTPQLIMSNDPEYEGAHSYANSDEQRVVKRALDDGALGKSKDMANRLKVAGIRYILVAKEFDHQKYRYLGELKGLKITRDTDTLRLYKIEPDKIE